MLQIWKHKNWEERIAEKIFDPSSRINGRRDLHAKIGNTYATMWFDGNLSLLKTIRKNARCNPDVQYAIFCFDCQAEFLNNSGYFSKCRNIIVKPTSFEVGEAMITWTQGKEGSHGSRASDAGDTIAIKP